MRGESSSLSSNENWFLRIRGFFFCVDLVFSFGHFEIGGVPWLAIEEDYLEGAICYEFFLSMEKVEGLGLSSS